MKKKISKKIKRNIGIASVVLILLLLLGWFLIPKIPVIQTALPGSPGNSGGSSGGTSTEDGDIPAWSFPNIDWTGWIPDWNFPWGSDDSDDSTPKVDDDLTPDTEADDSWFDFTFPSFSFPIVPEITLKANGEPCKSSDECLSDYCYLGNYAIGKCQDPPFDCSDYARAEGYDDYYDGYLGRTTCYSYALDSCRDTSRAFSTYQVPMEDCCVWNC